MLRTALRVCPRAPKSPSRSFVSTVLLTKAWENETVNELRTEAKRRGLSQYGTKATLITRLRKDDEQKSFAPAPSVSPQVSQQVRRASTTEVPGVPSTEAPPPLPKTYPKEFLDVKLPALSELEPEQPVQIPFMPDQWDSSRIKAEYAPKSDSADEATPKMVAVAGSATHHGGGPTYNLSNAEAEPFASGSAADNSSSSGFWQDLAADLNLPTSLKLPNAAKDAAVLFDVAETTPTSAGQEKTYSRTFDKDEVRGLWLLAGILGSSWLAAGFLKPSSVFAEKPEEMAEHAAESA